MPRHLPSQSEHNNQIITPPEFSRPLRFADFTADREHLLEEQANSIELVALARRFNEPAIERLAYSGVLAKDIDDLWRFRGKLQGRAIRLCVSTSEKLVEEVSEPLLVCWQDRESFSDDPTDNWQTEPLAAQFDLGEIAAQSFALALDPYQHTAKADKTLALTARPPSNRPFSDLAKIMAKTSKS